MSDSISSISCGFVVQQAVRQIHNKSKLMESDTNNARMPLPDSCVDAVGCNADERHSSRSCRRHLSSLYSRSSKYQHTRLLECLTPCCTAASVADLRRPDDHRHTAASRSLWQRRQLLLLHAVVESLQTTLKRFTRPVASEDSVLGCQRQLATRPRIRGTLIQTKQTSQHRRSSRHVVRTVMCS